MSTERKVLNFHQPSARFVIGRVSDLPFCFVIYRLTLFSSLSSFYRVPIVTSNKSRMLSRILQAILILSIIYPLTRRKELIQVFSELTKWYKMFVGSLFFLVVVGHLAGVNTFPFVAWSMYGEPTKGDPFVYEYTGVLRSGTREPLVPSRLLPSISADRITSKLYRQIGSLDVATDSTQKANLLAQHKETLAALAKLYSKKNPDDPMDVVIVSRTTLYLYPKNGVHQSEPEILWRVNVHEAAK